MGRMPTVQDPDAGLVCITPAISANDGANRNQSAQATNGLRASLNRLASKVGRQSDLVVRTPTSAESRVPVAMASSLFSLWGIAYGLLDTINSHVKIIMRISSAKSALLAAAYYGAYPFASFAASKIIRRSGYRAAFVVGLTIFGLGQFIVSIAADNFSLGGMVAGFFVIGWGIGTLERSANPYVVRCGPAKDRAVRINIAQAMAGIGTVIAPLIANAILKTEEPSGPAQLPPRAVSSRRAEAVRAVVVLYQACGAITLGIAVLFGCIFFGTTWVPEVPVEESSKGRGLWKKHWKHEIWSYRRLWLGAFANFCNMSCQVTVAQNVMNYATEVMGASLKKGAMYLSIAQALFVVGRFAFVGLCAKPVKFKPWHVLLSFTTGCVVFPFLTGILPGLVGIAMMMMIMFFEGPMFPTIFETASTGLGQYASLGEDIMIASISGGALLPPVFGKVADTIGASKYGTARAFELVAGFFIVPLLYALAINIHKPYRKILNEVHAGDGKLDSGDEENLQQDPNSSAVPMKDLESKHKATLSSTMPTTPEQSPIPSNAGTIIVKEEPKGNNEDMPSSAGSVERPSQVYINNGAHKRVATP